MSPILEFATSASFLILGVALALSVYRLAQGPLLPDRVAALDLIGITVIAAIAVWCVRTASALWLDLTTVLALLLFLSTVAFARYLERRSL